MINPLGSSSFSASVGSTDRSTHLQKMFARADADSDGKVTADEFTSAFEKSGKARPAGAPDPTEIFRQLDTDEDGRLDESEFVEGMKQLRRPPPPPLQSGGDREKPSVEDLFKAIDRDGDGSVTVGELKADFEKRQAERAERSGGTEKSDRPALDFEKLLASLDADASGSLSQDEFATLLENFSGPPPAPPGAAYGEDGSAQRAARHGSFSAQA